MITKKTGFGIRKRYLLARPLQNVASINSPDYHLKTSKAYPVALINKDAPPRLQDSLAIKKCDKRYNEDKKQSGENPALIIVNNER